jgi:hypothetical protein
MFGTSTSSIEVSIDFTHDHDPSRFRRLAALLLSPSTTIIGSTMTVAASS